MAGTGKEKGNRLSAKRTLPRERRLQSAKEWLPTYTGEHLVRAYAKRYRVDLLCAIRELRSLGKEISEEYVRTTLDNKVRQSDKKKSDTDFSSFQNEDFAFIAGYTSGGFPYGITWNELTEEERNQYISGD